MGRFRRILVSAVAAGAVAAAPVLANVQPVGASDNHGEWRYSTCDWYGYHQYNFPTSGGSVYHAYTLATSNTNCDGQVGVTIYTNGGTSVNVSTTYYVYTNAFQLGFAGSQHDARDYSGALHSFTIK